MPEYLFHVNYSVEGAKGILKDGGTKRREVVDRTVQGLGGSVESFYYAYGDDDAYLIADPPSDETPAALSLAVAAAGGARVKTVPLLTPEQVDSAAKASVDYTPLGG
jgi:uncharacterized protein with GYD domain